MAATAQLHDHASAGNTFSGSHNHTDSNSNQSLGSTQDKGTSKAIGDALKSSSSGGSNGGHNHGGDPSLPNLLPTSEQKFDRKVGGSGGDRMVGSNGNDFLRGDNETIRVSSIVGTGPGEFPFPNNSPGTTTVSTELKDGKFSITGDYKDFEGKPLLQGGGTKLDPNATVPAGVDGQATIDGFVRACNDVEGNDVFKTGAQHIHFGVPGTADATVIRNVQANPDSDSSGKISGSFNLKPEEEAAAASTRSDGKGVFYLNSHTTEHIVGETRAELGNGKQG